MAGSGCFPLTHESSRLLTLAAKPLCIITTVYLKSESSIINTDYPMLISSLSQILRGKLHAQPIKLKIGHKCLSAGHPVTYVDQRTVHKSVRLSPPWSFKT